MCVDLNVCCSTSQSRKLYKETTSFRKLVGTNKCKSYLVTANCSVHALSSNISTNRQFLKERERVCCCWISSE